MAYTQPPDNRSVRRPPRGILETLRFLIGLLLDWLRGEKRRPAPEPEPIMFFVPAQIGLVATHPADTPPAEVVAGLQQDLREIAPDAEVRLTPERVVTFRSRDGQALSLAFGDLPAARAEPRLLTGLVKRINARRRGQFRIPGDAAPEQRPPTNGRATLGGSAGGPVTLSGAVVNWLASGAPKPGGTGGPGAPPTLAPANGGGLGDFVLPAALLKQVQATASDGPAAAVQVAILDTAPCAEDLRRARAQWPGHWLLKALLEPGDERLRLRISYGGYTHLLALAPSELIDHPYVMSDHGLFVAGIVRSIAPQAPLHLVEVLNPYGIGSLETLTRGFALLADEREAQQQGAGAEPLQPLVVNCSLVMNLPPATPEAIAEAARHDAALGDFTPEEIRQSAELLAAIIRLLRQQEVYLVAAAGNDARSGVSPRPAARFPAAFDGVTGVAALNLDGSPAAYSNYGDAPTEVGLATYGGDGTASNPGMRGVYIGVFPDGTPNTTGWAYWSGTSFATPVISGALALALTSAPLDPLDPVRPLRAADATPVITLDGSVFGEPFTVSQT